jgi:hypothetical protein
MRRAICLAALLLFSALGCSPERAVTTKNGIDYLHVLPESLDRESRRSYSEKHVDLVVLVGANGYARLASHLFYLIPGLIPSDPVKPKSGYRMMRVRGTFLDGGGDGPALALDGAEPIDGRMERWMTIGSVDANPKGLDATHVAIQGTYVTGVEASWLDERIWVELPPQLEAAERDTYRAGDVRIEGWLFTRGAHFGHMGRGRYLLVAEKCTTLIP